MGGTVRFLHVEGIGRQVELSNHVMSAPGVPSGSISCRNPMRRDQWHLLKEDLLLLLFSWKINFFSFVFLSSH